MVVEKEKTVVPNYDYLRLVDAITSINQKVNFYGLVTEYEQGKRTRGSDMICTMTVEDMSLGSPGLRVLVFATTTEGLPVVKSLGDIIRFHRAQMTVYNGAPQAQVKIKMGASFLVFDGTDGSGYIPYHGSSNNYTMKDHDKRLLDLMRTWGRKQTLNQGINDYLVQINGIKDGNFFDLCCKILVVDHRELPHKITLYVWDGTDVRPSHITVSKTESHLFPLVEVPPPLTREMISTFPPIGTALPVVPDVPLDDLPLQLPKPGSWIKFRNLGCRVRGGMYEAVFLNESKTCLLSSNSEMVKKCESIFEKRMLDYTTSKLSQWCPKPLQSITVTEHDKIPFSTLREILNHPQVTFKFHCLVRMVSILPRSVEEFCALSGSSGANVTPSSVSKRQSRKGPNYIYRLRLTLEDATARIPAYLSGEDAEYFFGLGATDVQQCGAAARILKEKVQKLLGFEEYSSYGSAIPEIRYNPPWVKCCLKSYYLEKDCPWETRRYKIFGTTLI